MDENRPIEPRAQSLVKERLGACYQQAVTSRHAESPHEGTTIMTTMTPDTPTAQRPPEPSSQMPPVERAPLTPPFTPPYGWQTPYPPTWQQASPTYEPTAGMRLALAITSLVLLIPLSAIALGSAVTLAGVTAAWLGILVGMLAFLLVCAAVVGVNVAFNIDRWRSMRR